MTRRPIDRVIGLVEAAAFLTAVFSLATIFDQLHRYLELFSHFRLQYLTASIVLCFALAASRRRAMSGLMLAITLVNAAYVLPWYSLSAQAAGAESLTLLHANIFIDNHDADELLNYVDREKPDLVFIQELTHEHLSLLVRLERHYPHRLSEPRGDQFGVGVWSRYPFESAGIVRTPPRDLPSIQIKVTLSGAPLTIFSTHPVPPVGRVFFEDRNRQLDFVAEALGNIEGSRAVIGDLNITPWAAHYRAFERDTGLVNVQRGHGIKPSWPVFLPIAMIPIDHALVSDDLTATEVRMLGPIGSDHLPLLVRIERR